MESRIPTASNLKSKTVKRENTIKIGREKNSSVLLFCSSSFLLYNYQHPRGIVKSALIDAVNVFYGQIFKNSLAHQLSLRVVGLGDAF